MRLGSKAVLGASGVVLFVLGIVLNFAPQETARLLGAGESTGVVLIIQTLAGALGGMGILDWFSRANRVGGIYGRPLALGNLLLFGIAAISLWRAVGVGGVPRVVAAVVASGLALDWAWLLFVHDPVAEETRRVKQ